MSQDPTNKFLTEFGNGNILEALQAILPEPGYSYDLFQSQNGALLKAICNYVDASVFNTPYETIHTNRHLQKVMHDNLGERNIWQKALKILSFEDALLSYALSDDNTFKIQSANFHPEIVIYIRSKREGSLLQENEIQEAVNSVPLIYRSCLAHQIKHSQAWNSFKQHKPSFGALTRVLPLQFILPWYPFCYKESFVPKIYLEGEIPLVFLEPFTSDYSDFLAKLPATSVFVFETKAHFMQLLQFPEVLKALKKNQNLIYILELPPNIQFLAQDHQSLKGKSFHIIHFSNKPIIISEFENFKNTFKICCEQSNEELKKDTQIANQLHKLCKNILFKMREEQLGPSRASALMEFNRSQGLKYDGGNELDYFGQKLNELERQRQPRVKKSSQKKIKLAHIVPQFVDQNHAPTDLLNAMLLYYDKDKFEILLISSERLAQHPSEYPTSLFSSHHSFLRAPVLLKRLENEHMNVFLSDPAYTFDETAISISNALELHQIDIALFHSPDVISHLSAAMSAVPVCCLLDNGTLPEYPGFDIFLVKSEAIIEANKELFQHLNMKTCVLDRDASTDARQYVANLETILSNLYLGFQ